MVAFACNGLLEAMKFRKIINKAFGSQDDDVNVAGQVTGAVNANVGERGSQRTRVSSKVRVVQRDGVTEVSEATAVPAEREQNDQGESPEEKQ